MRGISGSTLKMIAVVSMLIDHSAATVVTALRRVPSIADNHDLAILLGSMYRHMRDVGRFAFPIFCFLLVEGFLHTRDVKKYAARLFLFALISEIPFDFSLKTNWFYPSKQNVYFTLLLGLLVLWGLWICREMLPMQMLILISGLIAARLMKTDYSYKGVFLIEVLYLFRFTRLYQCLGGAAAVSWELPAPLGFIPIYFYNGTRGRDMRHFFYWFYPAHLIVLGIIAKILIPAFLH